MKTQTITLAHLPDILLVVLPEEAKYYYISPKSRLVYSNLKVSSRKEAIREFFKP